jgi:hypothetical protein
MICRRTKPTFYGFPVFSVAVMEKCCDACCYEGILLPVRLFRRQRVPVFHRHRMPLIGSRWDIRWLIGRRTKPTFYGFPVFSLAVMQKCCDARVTGSTISCRVFRRQRVPLFQEASTAVDRKSMGHTVDDLSSN